MYKIPASSWFTFIFKACERIYVYFKYIYFNASVGYPFLLSLLSTFALFE